jgi:hypothetical protein
MALAVTATREALAVYLGTLGTYISLHSASPGSTGANEATGGSPAYGRKQTTWAAGSSDGSITGSQVTFDAAAGTYSHYGIWSAATGGTFVDGGALSTSVTLSGQGQILVTPTESIA